MSTQSASAIACPSAGASGVIRYRVSVRQFKKMIDAGVFGEHDHVELLEGILVDKMTKKPPHNFTVAAVAEAFRAIVGGLGGLRGEIGRSRPFLASGARRRDRARAA